MRILILLILFLVSSCYGFDPRIFDSNYVEKDNINSFGLYPGLGSGLRFGVDLLAPKAEKPESEYNGESILVK